MQVRSLILAVVLSAPAAFSVDAALLNLVMPEARLVAGIDVERAKDSFLGKKMLESMDSKDSDFAKFVLPASKKLADERAEKIEGGLKRAEAAQAEAAVLLKQYQEALAEARRAHNKRTAEYLVSLPMLGDYLEEGLAAFGADCDNFEMGRL